MPRPCSNCGMMVELEDYVREPLREEARRLGSGLDEACGYATQGRYCDLCRLPLRHGDPIIRGAIHADCFLADHASPVRVIWLRPNDPIALTSPPPPPTTRNWMVELFGPDLRPKPVTLHIDHTDELGPHHHQASYDTESQAHDAITRNYIGDRGTVAQLFQDRTIFYNRRTFRLVEGRE